MFDQVSGQDEAVRCIIGSRVSVFKGDAKVSHIAQRETTTRYATERSWTIIDYFEDLDVSASIPPQERPDLGPWLTQRYHEWDAVIWAKVDRAFRSAKDCADMAHWAEQNRKVLVFADDGIVLDFRGDTNDFATMMAKFFLMIASLFAEMELRRFRQRTKDAQTALRHTDRWGGGNVPEGYMTAPHPSGKGRTLIVDPVRREVVHKMADLLIGGSTFNQIAWYLNEEGIETAADYRREPGKKKGTKWVAGPIINVLTSPASMGIKRTEVGKGRYAPVLDETGEPIRIADPLFTLEQWRDVQLAASARRNNGKSRMFGASPLLDVIFCGVCKNKASRRGVTHRYSTERTYLYYTCNAKPKHCTGVTIVAADAEALVENEFLANCGHQPVARRVFIPGSDNSQELQKVKGIIDALRSDREQGLIVGPEDEARFTGQMKNLLARRHELELSPRREARWEYEPTGELYSDAWTSANEQERRKMLVDAGVRLEIYGKSQWNVMIPNDIADRLRVVSAT